MREIAEAKGVNLTQLARRADVTRETAERYWNNQVTRPTQALIKLARALECTVEDLIPIVNPHDQRPDARAQPPAASRGPAAAEPSPPCGRGWLRSPSALLTPTPFGLSVTTCA